MNTVNLEKKSALLVIDMQNDFVMPGSPACVKGAFQTIDKIYSLLELYRSLEQPVFHVIRAYRNDGSDIEITRHNDFMKKEKYVVPNTKGAEIVDRLKPLDGEYVIVKNRFSAFMNTELDFMLRRLGVSELTICGTQYPNCIRATVFDAVSYGYPITLVRDATSAATPEIEKANIIDIENIGVPCMTLNEYKGIFKLY